MVPNAMDVSIPEKELRCTWMDYDTRRQKMKDALEQRKTYWQDRNIQAMLSLFSENGCLVANKDTFKGVRRIGNELQGMLDKFDEVYLHVKRSLIDADQMVGSLEAIMRTKVAGATCYHEKQTAWIVTLESSCDGADCVAISKWQVWTDPVADVTLKSLETPLPSELWKCAQDCEPLDRERIGEAILRKVRAYTTEDVRKWGETVTKDVILHPPWDLLTGMDTCKKSINVYFENYTKTQITPIGLLYDRMQPNFAVYQQIFKTTNKATGKQGEDIDFVFIEIVDNKIRYWRTYFDTTSSAQKGDSTFRQVFAKKITTPTSSPRGSPCEFGSPSSSPVPASPLGSSPMSMSPLSVSPLARSFLTALEFAAE